jgi:hypothetical protein
MAARYSAVSQLRSNVPRLTATVIPDADVEDRIDESDDIVETDLSKVVDFSTVTAADATTTPKYINQLSQYKAAELSLVAKYGAKRMVETQSDRQYWEKMYNDLLEKILNGEIDITDEALGSPDYQNNVKEDVPPAIGMGEYSGHIDDDDLEEQREDLGND